MFGKSNNKKCQIGETLSWHAVPTSYEVIVQYDETIDSSWKLTGRGPRMASDGLCSRPWAVSGNRALGAPLPPSLPPSLFCTQLHPGSDWQVLTQPIGPIGITHPDHISRQPSLPAPAISIIQPLLGHHGITYWKQNISRTSALAEFEIACIYPLTFIRKVCN